MRHLSPAKPHGDLGLIPVAKETPQISKLGLVVSLSGSRSKFDFLELDLLLFLARRLPLFALLKDELAIVHQPANRWLCIRRDLHKVKFSLFGERESLVSRDDSDLFSVRTDKAQLSGSDLFVEPVLFLRDDIYSSC